MDIGSVDPVRALGLRQNEIGEEREAEKRVKGEPGEDEPGPGLEECEEGEDDPVHEPWR